MCEYCRNSCIPVYLSIHTSLAITIGLCYERLALCVIR